MLRGLHAKLTILAGLFAGPSGPAAAIAIADAASVGPDPRSARVLLVDDHAANRKVVELMLGPLDADLTQAENGAEAVDAFRAAPFDVVLMDLQMPVMDGLTAIRLIREHEAARGGPATPIVVISANILPEHVAAARQAGADDHLAKPINAAALYEALQRALSEPPQAAGETAVA